MVACAPLPALVAHTRLAPFFSLFFSLPLSLARAVLCALLVKLLAAMANVHMSTLKRLLPPLFLPTHPQLLTRGSCSCDSRRMASCCMRAMMMLALTLRRSRCRWSTDCLQFWSRSTPGAFSTMPSAACWRASTPSTCGCSDPRPRRRQKRPSSRSSPQHSPFSHGARQLRRQPLLSHNRRMHRQRQAHASASRLQHQLPRLTRSPKTAILLNSLQLQLLLPLSHPTALQLPTHASADSRRRRRCRRRRLMGRARKQRTKSVSQTSSAFALFRQRVRRHVLHLLLFLPLRWFFLRMPLRSEWRSMES